MQKGVEISSTPFCIIHRLQIITDHLICDVHNDGDDHDNGDGDDVCSEPEHRY